MNQAPRLRVALWWAKVPGDMEPSGRESYRFAAPRWQTSYRT
jgi:hypothetical protein